MYKIKHMSCLGELCEPLRTHRPIKDVTKEEYNSMFTLIPTKVNCPKCIEILKKQGILRKD